MLPTLRETAGRTPPDGPEEVAKLEQKINEARQEYRDAATAMRQPFKYSEALEVAKWEVERITRTMNGEENPQPTADPELQAHRRQMCVLNSLITRPMSYRHEDHSRAHHSLLTTGPAGAKESGRGHGAMSRLSDLLNDSNTEQLSERGPASQGSEVPRAQTARRPGFDPDPGPAAGNHEERGSIACASLGFS
ncbi:hypothetical protein [Arthrobacter roseus]|uniref:hypothetical protein n=1 Tax=Arthrobacter roseus TaxID=136274 RepID=UPI001EF8B74F|nr:hypothetical protein [Arthrobacter roseus]MBM7849754.1 hypothetical protein [Arthrobacter roseus]